MIQIHNGDAMLQLARRAALPGEQIAFREALVSGPLLPGPEWLATRARHLAAGQKVDLLRVSNSLFEQEQALDAAAAEDEIVLWFEHDLYCLLHFVYLLDRFRNRNVSFVWCADVLASRDDGELLTLYNSRRAATPDVFDLADRVWRAVVSPDPRHLNELLSAGSFALPFVREGLLLHAARFPSPRNGLGAVENRLMTLIGSGATDMSMLLPQFDSTPPRYGLGDSQILDVLRRLAGRAVPLVIMGDSGDTPSRMIFALTPAGENVLGGTVNDLEVNDRDEWIGGVHLTKENVWQWDESRGQLIPSPSAGW